LRWLNRYFQSPATVRNRHAGLAVVLSLAGCLSGLFILDSLGAGPFEAARSWVFDRYQRLWPPDRPVARTVVVEIDEESIRRFGQWPWPRDLVAALLNAVRGVRAIGVDVLMPDPDRLSPDDLIRRHHIETPALRDALLALPQSDAVLAAALRAQPTVLAMTVENHDDDPPNASVAVEPVAVEPVREQGDIAFTALPHDRAAVWPLPILADAASAVGVVTAVLAPFGGVEKLSVATQVRGTVLPGFAAELIRVALKAGSIVLKARSGILSAASIDGLTFPIDPSGDVRPRFVGPARLTTIKAYRLLDPNIERPNVAGKIAVVGVTAPGVGETFLTPLGMQESGPAIQAEMIESVLANDTLWRPFWAEPGERAAALVLGLAGGLLVGRVRYWTYAASVTGVLVILVVGSVWAFRYHGLLLDWVFPACCLLVLGLVASTARTSIEVAARRRHEADLAVERVRRTALEHEMALRTEAETLRESLAFAADAARLGAWDADMRSGAWHHSPRHDTILGLATPPARWSPDLLLSRVVPEDREAVKRSLTEGQASGSLQLECGIRRPDGTTGYVHILGRFWKDSAGVPSRVAGVVLDITKPREMELRLRQGEKMATIGLLAGGVAHNFNNLLTVVLGNLELASNRTEASGRMGLLLGNATEAARKSAEIARHLLAFARLQSLNPRSVDAGELLHGIFSMIRSALPARVRTTLKMAPCLGTIVIDPMDFELTLLNLAFNARDAMPDGGHLVIHAFDQRICNAGLGLDGDFLVLEVRDDGEGMSADIKLNAFKPFFTTKPVGQGTGLGLSQVHGFAHQSGGAVDLESVPGQGTCVTLYLPLTKQEARPAELRQREVSS
jgi:signal transduction histidine kinase